MSKVTRCMIVDDEPLAIELLAEYVKQTPDLQLVATADNPIKAMSLIKESDIDLIFLDIQMPVLTGIDMMKTLTQPPDVIFTTAYRDYAVESYELDAVDYLMKPITYVRFLKSINKYLANSVKPDIQLDKNESPKAPDVQVEKEALYVNVNKKFVKVIFKKIRYVESVKDYLNIHLEDKTIITKETISNFDTLLPDYFIRVHRSFIVNRAVITAYTKHDIELDKTEIPIGASYKEEVLQMLKS